MRALRLTIAGLLAFSSTTGCASAAQADALHWQPPVEVLSASSGGSAGIDDAGNVSMVFQDAEERPVGITRRAGSSSFSAPVVLADQPAFGTLKVGPDGHLSVLIATPCGFSCGVSLEVRTGPSLEQLSAPHRLDGQTSGASMAVGEGGRTVVAWRSGKSFLDPVVVATKQPGSGFGAPQVLQGATPEPPGTHGPGGVTSACPGENLTEPQTAVAINASGSAIVSWRQRTDLNCGHATLYAAVAGPNAPFGPREPVAADTTEVTSQAGNVAVSLDPDGTAHALYAPSFGAVARATRPPGGVFSSGVDTGWEHLLAFTANAEGDQVATVATAEGGWDRGTERLALRPAGGEYGASKRFGLPGGPAALGLDGRGNLLGVVRDGGWPEQLRGFALNGPGFASVDLSPPTSPGIWSADLAVNRSGAAVAVLGGSGPNWDSPRHLYLLERSTNTTGSTFVALPPRPPRSAVGAPRGGTSTVDRKAPLLSVTLAVRHGMVSTRLRCNEACRVGAVLAVSHRKRRVVTARSRPRKLARGRRGGLDLRLSRSQRRSVGRLLAAHRRARAVVVFRVRDEHGNARDVRRAIPVRRLAR